MASVRDLELVAWRTMGLAIPRRRTDPSVTLRLLAHVPSFLPVVRAGSEVSMAVTLQLLAGRGHQVTVMVDTDGVTGDVEGLAVVARPRWRDLVAAYRDADVVLTQLSSRNAAMRLGALTRTPVVQLAHMGKLVEGRGLGTPALAVFASAWLRDASVWSAPGLVLHPPLLLERYATTPGHAVTLVNLNERKGGPQVLALARRCPELEFLGVEGGWGAQDVPGATPPNLTVIAPVSDMREVYARTRVLLMPSDHESYGRVGLEAACSGIPTIASPVAGIREALGDAALYADRDDLDQWVTHLRRLDDPAEYARRSDAARARAAEVAAGADPEISDLEAGLRRVVRQSG